MLNNELAELLGIGKKLGKTTTIKQLRSPSTYFVHCDLVDKEQNLPNREPWSVLARFDTKGEGSLSNARKLMSCVIPLLAIMSTV